MKLIVGLGNPGRQYARTRHNIGFVAIDAVREALEEFNPSAWELSKKFNAEICGCTIKGEKIILAKPMTFMNDSGIAVALVANYYKIGPTDIIVIHDDKDIRLGEIKVQANRGHAGHNGVRSIMEHIGERDFTRVRFGVKNANEKKMTDTAKFVLQKFGLFEKKKMEASIKMAVAEIKKLIEL